MSDVWQTENKNFIFDVIICGAGPAGCSAALAMRNSGLKVALIYTQNRHPEKICGGALAAYIPKVLNSIHPDYVIAFQKWQNKNPVNRMRIQVDEKIGKDFVFSETGYIVQRKEFDRFLMQLVEKLSNVTVFSNEKISDVFHQGDRVQLFSAKGKIFSCSLLIGCDGARSIVKKKLMNEGVERNHHATAVRTYFNHVKGHSSNTFELHFLKELAPGYLWIFPISETVSNVGLGIPSRRIPEKRISIKKLFLDTIDSYPHLKKRFTDAEQVGLLEVSGLPLGTKKRVISGNRFMLCGDAASLINPLTGEGIGQAMVSGRYAGWHARACFQSNTFDTKFMQKYDTVVYKKIWKENHRSQVVAGITGRYHFLLKLAIRLSMSSKFFQRQFKNFIEK